MCLLVAENMIIIISAPTVDPLLIVNIDLYYASRVRVFAGSQQASTVWVVDSWPLQEAPGTRGARPAILHAPFDGDPYRRLKICQDCPIGISR